MCGIAGAFGHIDDAILDAVQRASAAQVHRGPDGHGEWASGRGERQAAFAHRRLSIIDLGEGGRQPMVHGATGNVLCFNGEIYNYRALRAELRERGHAFESKSDSEVLLVAYAEWGEACLERLRGMFAFALWDATRERVLLARDRLGIKPLYLAAVRTSAGQPVTLFSSEVRSLLATGLVDRRLCPEALRTYLWNGFVQGPRTIIEGILSMQAGTSMWMDAGHVGHERPYWQIPVDTGRLTEADDLRAALSESVKLHLVSDVPLGVFLSGGIDSSAIAAMAAVGSDAPIRTFNVCFEEVDFDESPWARKVAQSIGSDHQEVRLTEATFQSELDDALDALDQPTFDGVNTYFVSKAVREAGITVALSGAGGDELFGGYTSFRDLPPARRVSRFIGPVTARLYERGSQVLQRLRDPGGDRVPSQTRWGKLADVLATGGDMVALYQTSYALFTQSFLDQLSTLPEGDARWGLGLHQERRLRELVAGEGDLQAISALELACFLGERLLRDTDTASMAVSLEVRVPLLDHEVVYEASRLAADARYQPLGQKQVLRRAALDRMPPALFDRPKSGFVLPIEVWSRQRLQPDITAAFADEQACSRVGLDSHALGRLWRSYQAGAPGMYWSRIWALVVLLRWCDRHGARL